MQVQRFTVTRFLTKFSLVALLHLLPQKTTASYSLTRSDYNFPVSKGRITVLGEQWPCLEVLEAKNKNYRNIRLSFNETENSHSCSIFIHNSATGQVRLDGTEFCWAVPEVNENDSLYQTIILTECDFSSNFQVFDVDSELGRVKASESGDSDCLVAVRRSFSSERWGKLN